MDIRQINAASNPEVFAVKKYKLQSIKDEYHSLSMIVNEIIFLRKLIICENIVQLEKVYLQDGTPENKNGKLVCLVMKFAKYGSILKHFERRE